MNALIEQRKDGLLLVGRVLMMALFVIFGWDKITGFSGTEAYMASTGIPAAGLATVIAIVMELVVGIALVLGVLTRPLALLLAVYTLGTALIGHQYWAMSGMERFVAETEFFKNVSIIGGLFLLAVTGPGKYAISQR
jgi:putative oxidoreductase